MSAEWFTALATMTATGSLAMLAVLALRLPVRHRFGAQIAYAMWIAVPLVVCAMLLPAPAQPVAAFMRVGTIGAATHLVATGTQNPFDLRSTLLLLWLLGVVVSMAWFVAQQHRYLRSLGHLRALGSDRDARIVQSEFDVDGPALVGAWRPRIVLPGDFDATPPMNAS